MSDNRKSSNKESILETSVGNEARLEYLVYSQLCKSPLNVRKKALTEIEGLTANISVKGPMQNLVAHAMKVASEEIDTWCLRRSATVARPARLDRGARGPAQ